MKKTFLSFVIVLLAKAVIAQSYPEPEFSKEVYLLKKDSAASVLRLEKGSSKLDTKTKMGGMGGSESGYLLEGEKSTVRIHGGNTLSFVFSNGVSGSSTDGNAKKDSMLRANGVDPSMIQKMSGMSDPSSTITLYKAESGKGGRKILMMKSPGAFGGKKMRSSDKYTFSVRKIREGYWELVIDKSLPKGEYAFSMTGMGMGNMDGSTTLFAFAID
jgi:hypothetical protein